MLTLILHSFGLFNQRDSFSGQESYTIYSFLIKLLVLAIVCSHTSFKSTVSVLNRNCFPSNTNFICPLTILSTQAGEVVQQFWVWIDLTIAQCYISSSQKHHGLFLFVCLIYFLKMVSINFCGDVTQFGVKLDSCFQRYDTEIRHKHIKITQGLFVCWKWIQKNYVKVCTTCYM